MYKCADPNIPVTQLQTILQILYILIKIGISYISSTGIEVFFYGYHKPRLDIGQFMNLRIT